MFVVILYLQKYRKKTTLVYLAKDLKMCLLFYFFSFLQKATNLLFTWNLSLVILYICLFISILRFIVT